MKSQGIALLLAVMLNACGGDGSSSKVTQVVAKVNGDEITVHQINTELQSNPGLVNSQAQVQAVLESLIARQLLVQEAIKLNLDHSPEVVQKLDVIKQEVSKQKRDRSPEVMQKLESIKMQIYAEAYLTHKLPEQSMVSLEESKQYIDKYPELFDQHKVLHSKKLVFVNQPEKFSQQKLESEASTIETLQRWLNQERIAYQEEQEAIPAEDLPVEVLTILDKLKVDDVIFINDTIQVTARGVTKIVNASLSDSEKQSLSTRLLQKQKKQQLILEEVKRLKRLAKIEILNPAFAGSDETSKLKEDAAANHMEQGLKGL